MLNVVVWRWGTKYPDYYVERLKRGLARHLPGARVLIVEPKDDDKHLTEVLGCFARLRTFDHDWQAKQGIESGQNIVVIDLDLIITGALDQVFNRSGSFVILQGINSVNPNPYNGSVWMLRAGYRPDVWTDFSLEKAANVPFYAFPDDQAWMFHKIPRAAAFTPKDGVYGFCKPGWPKGYELPKNAKIVAFPGHRDPSQFEHLDWVKQHWS